MSEPLRNGAGQGSPGSERQPHHISAIAHLFFAENEQGEPLSGATSDRDVVVTCFNDTRISANACAGLIVGTRQLEAENPALAVQLVEDINIPWSAESFLTEEIAAAVKSDYVKTGTTVRWTHLPALPDEKLTSLEVLAGTRGEIPTGWATETSNPGRHGLVACLLEREMGQWGPAFRLGRLIGLLAPENLEIIIFADSWAKSGGRPGTDTEKAIAPSAELLDRCRSLTRAVAGACPVTITTLASASADPAVSPGAIFQKIAARLSRDISVDPNS